MLHFTLHVPRSFIASIMLHQYLFDSCSIAHKAGTCLVSERLQVSFASEAAVSSPGAQQVLPVNLCEDAMAITTICSWKLSACVEAH